MSVGDRHLAARAERRDPTAATRPLGWLTPGHPMVPEWDAHRAIKWGYYANVFVYACIRAIAEDLAALPFRCGTVPPAQPYEPGDYDTDAPLARLLGPAPYGPNQATSAEELWDFTLVQYLATGRFGWEVEETNRPVALWPLVSQYLKAIPSNSGSRYFSSFTYGRPSDERGLPADRVVYGWRPSAHDWRQPESVLQAARLDVSVAVMQDRYDYAFLNNDARPAAVVVHEQFERADDQEAWRRQFTAEHQGPDNAGKVIFAEAIGTEGEGVKGALAIETLGLSQKDAEFINRYKQKIRNILVAFGVPVSRLGDASERTFSNAGQEWVNYWRRLLTLGRKVSSAVNMQLAPKLGREVGWFDFSAVDALKPTQRFAAFSLRDAIETNIVDANEIRELVFNLPPRPEPEEPVVVPPAPVTAAPSEEEEPVSRRTPDEGELMVVATEDAPEHSPAPPSDLVLAERRRTRIWYRVDAQVRSLERVWERAWRRLFARQLDTTLRRLEGKRGRQAVRQTDPAGIFDAGFWEVETIDFTAGLYESVFAVGGARVSDAFGLAFDLEAPYAREFVTARANQLSGPVTNTTYEAIKAQMAEGVAAGEDIPTLARRIRAVFSDAATLRARTIARTEVISAFNGSGYTVAAQLPGDVVGGQEWIATRDARVRPSHAEADGQRVRVGHPFAVGGAEMAYPGDPSGGAKNTVNCRCTMAFLTPAEMGDVIERVPTSEVRQQLCAMSLDKKEVVA
jgi:HK97 family phage portal protein